METVLAYTRALHLQFGVGCTIKLVHAPNYRLISFGMGRGGRIKGMFKSTVHNYSPCTVLAFVPFLYDVLQRSWGHVGLT